MSDVLDEADLQIRNARLADAGSWPRRSAPSPHPRALGLDARGDPRGHLPRAHRPPGWGRPRRLCRCHSRITREETLVGHAILDPLKLAVTAHVVDLTLAVHEGYQRKGIGLFLLSHLITWARSSPTSIA